MRRRKRQPSSSGSGALAGLTGFTDLEPMAAGGTSQVFRARQPAMDRHVAIKVLGRPVLDPKARARFERELALTGRLSAHPLFVTLHGHGVSDAGYPYLVMPWHDGGSLADRLRATGPLPVPAALAVGIRIAAALAHLHEQGLVHCDVKPGNVLFSDYGEALLADLGAAGQERDQQGATTVFSPLHVAPELLRGERVTAACDVWSLSSTLCTALAGVPPFVVVGSGGVQVRDMARLDAPPLPLARPDCPPALRELLIRGLAVDPQLRPSAADLAEQLRRIQAGLGLATTGLPSPTTLALPAGPTTPAATAGAGVGGGSGRYAAVSAAPLLGASAADATVRRSVSTGRPRRSRSVTVATALAGSVAGAALAVVVLLLGQAALLPPTVVDALLHP